MVLPFELVQSLPSPLLTERKRLYLQPSVAVDELDEEIWKHLGQARCREVLCRRTPQ